MNTLPNDDDLIQIAYSIHSSPGTYALLLGSGVSRAAGIPTGWEITLDLIRKIAATKGEESIEKPEEWYRSVYGVNPSYSEIIDKLASTQAERSSQLSHYFEPTPEDVENGIKIPTKAHRAIADLVRMGYFKIIITTNFDQLLETALKEQGVTPTIVDSDDSLHGAIPYVHTKCTLIKIHGDYKDTRIRNTPKELETYSDEMVTYVNRLLDDFGLLICGWSGEWDVALRNILISRRNRRFSTFWAMHGTPTPTTLELVERIGALVLPTMDADHLFSDLAIKINSLESLKKSHLLTVPLAIEETKIYLSEDKHRIKLHDMTRQIVDDACVKLSKDFPTDIKQMELSDYRKRMHNYEELMKLPSSVISVIAYFDRGDHIKELTEAMTRFLHQPNKEGKCVLIDLQLYPAYILMYSAGISALESGNYSHMRALLTKPVFKNHRGSVPAIEVLNSAHIFSYEMYKQIDLPNAPNLKTPVSDYMHIQVNNLLKPLILDNERLDNIFDIFEYLCGLVYIDMDREEDVERVWGPIGRFINKYYGWNADQINPMDEFFDEGIKQGAGWPLLTAGFFDGSIDRFNECRKKYETLLEKVAQSRYF